MDGRKNMVDERMEFAALIFRLAGRGEYSELRNDYQKKVAETFAGFANHKIVEYVNDSGLNGYDDVAQFVVQIEKKDGKFIFIDGITFPFNCWGETVEKEFLQLFNDFYIETNYAEFYNSHISYFEQETQKFIDESYGAIDFEWFRKYVDPSDLRCILSPSNEPCGYGAFLKDKVIYAVICTNGGYAIVHEYCHWLGNPLGRKWYEENPEFKKWCDDSVNMETMPYYSEGLIMAFEYCTRSYDILYKVQHGANLEECLSFERDFQFANSFPYIKEVYEMLSQLQKMR